MCRGLINLLLLLLVALGRVKALGEDEGRSDAGVRLRTSDDDPDGTISKYS